jgi:hypothetical protein
VFAARLRGLPGLRHRHCPSSSRYRARKTRRRHDRRSHVPVGRTSRRDPASRYSHRAILGLGFRSHVLDPVCRIREGLLNRRSSAAVLLRTVMLGALHGPRAKSALEASYFSNKMPRTFAANPTTPSASGNGSDGSPRVDLLAIIKKRTTRVLSTPLQSARTLPADVQCADSRSAASFSRLEGKITHLVTSPPYYGLRTYSQDQWLREWFLGGPTTVNYRKGPGLDHGSPHPSRSH